MSAEATESAHFRQHLKRLVATGQTGRREIVSRLAAMPIEKLKDVPADVLSLLGPRGLAELAQRRSDLADLLPRRTPHDPGGLRRDRVARMPTGNQFGHALVVAVALALGALAIDLGRDGVRRWVQPVVRPASTAGWPLCQRLDRHVDGCVYRTGSPDMTIARAATLLGMDAVKLWAINKHLATSTSTTAALAAGSTIIVWRGVGRLGKGD